MSEKDEIRREQRALLSLITQETGVTPSALARAIKVAPSTINKVVDQDGGAHHVLSYVTIYRLRKYLEAWRRRNPRLDQEQSVILRLKGPIEIDPQILSDLLNSADNRQLLSLIGRVNGDVKQSVLDIFEAVTRIAGSNKAS
jgi:hypothetical protein